MSRAEQSRAEQSRAEQSRAEQSRAEQFDIARGIGISIVIFLHLSKSGSFLRVLAGSFVMPLFFWISGYFDKNTSVEKCVQKALKRLIIPAYIIVLFDILIYFAQCIVGSHSFPDLKEILSTLVLYGGVWKNFPIWFLMTLFVCKLMRCILGEKASYVVALLCMGTCALGVNSLFPTFWLLTSIGAFPFYMLGRLFAIKKIAWKKSLIALQIIMLIVVAQLNDQTDMYLQTNGKNWILYFLTGMLGTSVVMFFSNLLHKNNYRIKGYLTLLGENSITVLLTHYYFCRLILPKGLNFVNLGGLYDNTVFQLVMTFIIAVLYIVVIIAWRDRKRKRSIGSFQG
jgi:fucose 4-O-acetylase-like acetyltransferase